MDSPLRNMSGRLAILALLLAVSFTFLASSSAHADEKGDEWIQLFNGKDLSGWKIKIRGYELGDNYNDTFGVSDGAIKMSYDKYESFDAKFGHLFYETSFSDYVVRVEYRFTGEQCPGGPGWAFRNSGIMVHGQSAESMKKDQDFPNSIEVQLLGGEKDRTTANLCTPGTHVVMNGQLQKRHCISSKSKKYPGDQWVTVEVEVRGNKSIKHIIDGEVVLEYSQPQLNDGTQLEGGSISLQAESHPVEFRKVEIKPLGD